MIRRKSVSIPPFGNVDDRIALNVTLSAGIYLLAGPAAAALGEHRAYPIEAVAPTVLHLLDVAVPADHEAPVMENVLRPEFLAAHPVRSPPPLHEAARARGLALQRGRGARRRAPARARLLRMSWPASAGVRTCVWPRHGPIAGIPAASPRW